MKGERDIYSEDYVRGLFDEMSASYRLTNLISSFGFSKAWREQCVALAGIQPGMTVCDLMAGNGDCWPAIMRKLQRQGRLLAVDFCPKMCAQGRQRKARLAADCVTIHEQNALGIDLPDEVADIVVSSFGLKTFSAPQMKLLATQVFRILKPGGRFSLLEISVPRNPLLRWLYMSYLQHGIPFIGGTVLGNPDNYRMLGIYTERFGDCGKSCETFSDVGLLTECRTHFFGCATSLVGRKPDRGLLDI